MRLLIFSILLLPFLANAQPDTTYRTPLVIGFGLSGYSYDGDFSLDNAGRRIQPGGKLIIQGGGDNKLQMQFQAGFGKFSDQLEVPIEVNYQGVSNPTNFVETSFIFADLRMIYRFLRKKKVRPYVSLGAGLISFNPKDASGRQLQNRTNTRVQGEAYNNLIPQLPATVGLEVQIHPYVTLTAAYSYHLTPTDYLDNVGLLGKRSSLDALNGFSLSANFNLSRRWQEILGPTLPSDSGFVAQTIQNQEEAYAEAPVEIKEKPAEDIVKEEEPSKDTFGQSQEDREIDWTQYDAAWASKVKLAIENDQFVYHRISRKSKVPDLAKKLDLPAQLIRELNFLHSDLLPKGSYLRLPNVGLKLK